MYIAGQATGGSDICVSTTVQGTVLAYRAHLHSHQSEAGGTWPPLKMGRERPTLLRPKRPARQALERESSVHILDGSRARCWLRTWSNLLLGKQLRPSLWLQSGCFVPLGKHEELLDLLTIVFAFSCSSVSHSPSLRRVEKTPHPAFSYLTYMVDPTSFFAHPVPSTLNPEAPEHGRLLPIPRPWPGRGH